MKTGIPRIPWSPCNYTASPQNLRGFHSNSIACSWHIHGLYGIFMESFFYFYGLTWFCIAWKIMPWHQNLRCHGNSIATSWPLLKLHSNSMATLQPHISHHGKTTDITFCLFLLFFQVFMIVKRSKYLNLSFFPCKA